MPMGNLVAPYLSRIEPRPGRTRTSDRPDREVLELAVLSRIGAAMLVLPDSFRSSTARRTTPRSTARRCCSRATAFENWVRGHRLPAPLRNGRYRELAMVNVLQAVVTVVTIWLVHEQALLTAVAAIVIARATVSVLNLGCWCALPRPVPTLCRHRVQRSRSWPWPPGSGSIHCRCRRWRAWQCRARSSR